MRSLRMLCGVLFVCAMAASINIVSADDIVFISAGQTVNLTDSVTFNCTVDNPSNSTVMWSHRTAHGSADSTALTGGKQKMLRDERYQLHINEKETEYLLQINNVQASDAGSYECLLMVSVVGKRVRYAELLVNTPPQVDLSDALPPRPVNVGDNVTLHCKASGYPRPTRQWYRDDNELMPGGGNKYLGGELNINPVRPQDRGTYWCSAQNDVGLHQRSVNFEVQFRPQMRVPRPRVAQALGYDAALECVVEAWPAPQIEWFRRQQQQPAAGQNATTAAAAANDVPLRRDGSAAEQGYDIRTVGGRGEVTTSVLHVNGVQSKHYGNYVCQATNVAGQASAVMNLYTTSKPNINFALVLPATSSASLTALASMIPVLLNPVFSLIRFNN